MIVVLSIETGTNWVAELVSHTFDVVQHPAVEQGLEERVRRE
jgi:hypothetical protein